jgi:small-conductance mechanosensitive channel
MLGRSHPILVRLSRSDLGAAERRIRPKTLRNRVLPWFLVGCCVLPVLSGFSQTSNTASPTFPAVLQFLTTTIDWYRQSATAERIATEPEDMAYAEDNQRIADEVVRLAFDFARQQANLEAAKGKGTQSQADGSAYSQYQSLMQAAAAADQQADQTQSDLQALKQELESAPAKKKPELQSQIAETESGLALVQARRDALHSMTEFVNGASSTGSDPSALRSQVEELARSLPVGVAAPVGSGQPAAVASTAKTPVIANRPTTSGIWGLTADLFRLSGKVRTLAAQVHLTDALAQSSNQLRTPMAASLRQMIQVGDQLASQSQTLDPATLAKQKQQLDELTAQFKQVSASVIPLSKLAVLLEVYKRSLLNWQVSVRNEFRDELRDFLLRLGGLVMVLAIIFGFGEVWRRTILRYVQDVRRRYQFLLLRRIVLWIAIVLVLIFTFATAIGSIATFAGLITAGVALALQNVIVSVVGYFFLIGKYGIRVGDRVQVAGVTGEVVDIGLARFHLMELSNEGPESQPTGRVVAFSNSIVFQPTSGMFKQIPGTNFIWRQIALTFAPENDYHVVRERVNAAMERAFADYHEPLERQRRTMEQTLTSISAAELTAKSRLHFTSSGIEVVVRFPVLLSRASEMDDRLTRELFAEIDREPKLHLVGSEILAVKPAS